MQYEVGKLIGSGYRSSEIDRSDKYFYAKQQERFYVVKKLRMMQLQQKDRDNIQNELKLLQRLRHPNIVSYKDSYTEKEGNLCIVMIYCEGGDMDARIKSLKEKGKTFTESQILDWLVQTALAIYYLHNMKILHRDLKTQNLFLRKDQRVRLGDFGIAKMLDSAQDLTSTVIGTPYYMAPQLFKYKPYSYKSDIWSLGIILYEMCNLRRPFDAQSYQGLAVKILKGSYPTITPTYSKQLRDLITSMLSIKPQNRPTIVDILNKPFIRPRLQKYMCDMFARKNQLADMQDIYLDTLKEQAQLLSVGLIKQQQQLTIKPNPSLKDLQQKRGARNILSKRGEQQQTEFRRQLNEKRKSRDSHSLQKNIKRKDENNTTASSKALNGLAYEFIASQKQAFVDHNKKKMMEIDIKRNSNQKLPGNASNGNIHDSVMKQRQRQQLQYQQNIRRFKMQEDYTMDEQGFIQENFIDQEIIQQDSDEQLGETINFVDQDEQVPQRYNKSYYKILDQVRVLKHMCQTAIGTSKYLRAYNAVNNGSNKTAMLQILGAQMIGYWHLLDQIMFNQSILKTLPKQ